jgi:hypothetical protein
MPYSSRMIRQGDQVTWQHNRQEVRGTVLLAGRGWYITTSQGVQYAVRQVQREGTWTP